MVKRQTMSFTRQAESERLYAPLPTLRVPDEDRLQAVYDALSQGGTPDQVAVRHTGENYAWNVEGLLDTPEAG